MSSLLTEIITFIENWLTKKGFSGAQQRVSLGGEEGVGFTEEQIRLNHANEFPGVSFTERESRFSFFFSFLFTSSFILSSLLPFFTSHLPACTLGRWLV